LPAVLQKPILTDDNIGTVVFFLFGEFIGN